MAKPNWSKSVKSVYLTDAPKALPTVENEKDSFVCYSTFGEDWWSGWKTYSKLWTCLRYGMFLGQNSNQKTFIKNIRTNEIVWRSWEDENPYRMGI